MWTTRLVRPPEPDGQDEEIETDLIGTIVQPLRNGRAYKTGHYFKQVYQKRQPLSPWKICRLREFLSHFLWSIVTQWWMKTIGLDRRRLARIAEMMQQGQVRIAEVDYDAEKLNGNEQSFGRPSPAFAFALALLCADREILRDEDYGGHVRRVVDRAMEERKARLFPTRDET